MYPKYRKRSGTLQEESLALGGGFSEYSEVDNTNRPRLSRSTKTFKAFIARRIKAFGGNGTVPRNLQENSATWQAIRINSTSLTSDASGVAFGTGSVFTFYPTRSEISTVSLQRESPTATVVSAKHCATVGVSNISDANVSPATRLKASRDLMEPPESKRRT